MEETNHTLSIVVGGFWGDEGKGKLVSYLATSTNPDAIVRAGAGTNAGHTVVYKGKTYALRTIPSGFMAENAKIMVGAGVLINEDIFLKEVEETNVEGRVFVDKHTGVITQEHINRERKNAHLMGSIGSTGSGTGAANVDRVNRSLKLAKDFDRLAPYTTDVSQEVNSILDNGGKVIIEGSQATYLSLYHGSYPYVTSKDVCASACLSDVGVGPTKATDVIVVFKSYVTRVGEGELKGELSLEEMERLGWVEYGTVTSRPRRAAPFDFSLARKACQINGATSIALTKLDIVFPKVAGMTDAAEIPNEVMEFVNKVESTTGVKVKYLSTGPSAEEVIVRP